MIYDLDDNFFEIPPDSAVGRTCAQPRHLEMLTEYLTSASLVRVHSRPLLARAAELNPNVEMVAGAVDLGQIRLPTVSRRMDFRVRPGVSRTDSEVHPTRRPRQADLRNEPVGRFACRNLSAGVAAIAGRVGAAGRGPFLGTAAAA